ncbi:hypothetical protein, partial [Rhizobium sp. BR 314]|uniref:T1SS-143 repeat domain-containing protein n=1 Tax=Rhizobium sp. BR 314 TaxID=3040013 RepID=UPI0039BFE491
MSLISVTGNVIADEDLGIVTLAADSDPTSPDNNVTLSNFQTGIPASSSLGTSLTSIGLYPSTTTGTGTTQAIGISENAIISATVSNMIFSDSSGNTLNGVDSGFKAIDGNEIFLYSDPTNPDIVLGRESNSAGAVAFALLLQPTSGGATVWVVQYEALTNTNPAVGEDANTLDLANRVYVSGSSTASFNIGTKDPGQNYWLPFTDPTTTTTVLVTGLDASSTSPDTVNTSSSGDGSNSQSITPTEALRFDFVSSYTGGSTKDKTFLTDGTLNSLVYKEGTGATFDISQVTPTGDKVNIQIIAQNETGATFGSTQTNTSANTVALGEIDVYTTGGTLLASSTRTTGNNGITFGGTTSAPNGVVNGLGVDEVVKFFSAGGASFDQFVVENITGTGNTPGFDILNVTQTQTISATAEVGSHILFEDSVPMASANTQTATVDEDALVGEATGETGFGGTATGNVSNLFIPGVDTPLTYRLITDTSSLPTNVTSHGVAVTYAVTSSGGVDTLTASAGATTVFTLALTESTGAYTFKLFAAIDNETPQNGSPEGTFSFDVSKLLQATDADGHFAAGDTATAAANALKLTIIDDQPTVTANTQTATVDEDALVGEATGETGFGGTATGNISNLFNTGADTPATYS